LFQSLIAPGSGVFVEQQLMRLPPGFETMPSPAPGRLRRFAKPVLRKTFHGIRRETGAGASHTAAR
jgi:hypothetical protein